MKTIIVDDEKWALQQLEFEIAEEPDIEIVGRFIESRDACDYFNSNPVDFALLDV